LSFATGIDCRDDAEGWCENRRTSFIESGDISPRTVKRGGSLTFATVSDGGDRERSGELADADKEGPNRKCFIRSRSPASAGMVDVDTMFRSSHCCLMT